MTRMRIAARDRRMVAIHEAGHVTVARHVGWVGVSAWLEKTPDPGICEKLWIGHTRYLSPSIINKKIYNKNIDMFAVAGAVAGFVGSAHRLMKRLTAFGMIQILCPNLIGLAAVASPKIRRPNF
jgi:hypothetical protein